LNWRNYYQPWTLNAAQSKATTKAVVPRMMDGTIMYGSDSQAAQSI